MDSAMSSVNGWCSKHNAPSRKGPDVWLNESVPGLGFLHRRTDDRMDSAPSRLQPGLYRVTGTPEVGWARRK